MSDRVRCDSCRHWVSVASADAGKLVKCPQCGNDCYVPFPREEVEEIPLAPIDEEAERRQHALEKELRDMEIALARQDFEERDDLPPDQDKTLSSEDFHHYVVNFCMDLYGGNVQRAHKLAEQLRAQEAVGRAAVQDFISGKVWEPVLDMVPKRLLQGFLKDLEDRLRP